jgi:hypothetical protein
MISENPKNTDLKESLEKIYDTKLDQEEVLESERNLFGFFELLHQIDQNNKSNENNRNSN